MSFRFIAAIILLLIACAFEFLLASAGLVLSSILAMLIVSAFLFSFWELSILILLAVFFVNWQPGFSGTLLVFAAIPFAVWAFRRLLSLNPEIGVPAMIFCGIFVFYLIAAPALSLSILWMFLIDAVVSLIFGELVFAALNKAEK